MGCEGVMWDVRVCDVGCEDMNTVIMAEVLRCCTVLKAYCISLQ